MKCFVVFNKHKKYFRAIMYTHRRPRAEFSRLPVFFKVCLLFFLLIPYRSASDHPVWNKFRISVIIDRLESEGKVRSVYIHTSSRIMRFRDLAIWGFSRWPPAAILDLIKPEMPPSPKTPPRTKREGIGWRVAELWPFEIFPKCVNRPWGRSSVVGRQYSYFLHWSHNSSFATLGTWRARSKGQTPLF